MIHVSLISPVSARLQETVESSSKSFTHMFLFLVLSSLSMMKCCVLSGSAIRLGIVLLSPNSQALGPGHAVAERHLGGFPLQRGFIYQGFLLLQTGAAGIHQPRLKRKHPFLLLLLFLLSSYLTVRNSTYSHWAAWMPPSSRCFTPYYVSLLSFPTAVADLSLLPTGWAKLSAPLAECMLCLHYF